MTRQRCPFHRGSPSRQDQEFAGTFVSPTHGMNIVVGYFTRQQPHDYEFAMHNTALRDAELPYQKLIDVALNGVSLPQAKSEYETEMLRYGCEAVSNSLSRPFMQPYRA